MVLVAPFGGFPLGALYRAPKQEMGRFYRKKKPAASCNSLLPPPSAAPGTPTDSRKALRVPVRLSMLYLLSMPRPQPAGLDAIGNVMPPVTTATPGMQASRQGKAAITFFVTPESKAAIKAALADGGYGTSFQQGLVALLNELLAKQNRPPIA